MYTAETGDADHTLTEVKFPREIAEKLHQELCSRLGVLTGEHPELVHAILFRIVEVWVNRLARANLRAERRCIRACRASRLQTTNHLGLKATTPRTLVLVLPMLGETLQIGHQRGAAGLQEMDETKQVTVAAQC